MNFGIHVSQCGFLELPTFKLSHLFLGPRRQNNQEIAFWPTWYFLVSRNYWTCRSVSSDPEYLPQGHPIGDMTRWKGSLKSHIQVVGKLSQMAKNVWPGRYLFFLTWFFSCLTGRPYSCWSTIWEQEFWRSSPPQHPGQLFSVSALSNSVCNCWHHQNWLWERAIG